MDSNTIVKFLIEKGYKFELSDEKFLLNVNDNVIIFDKMKNVFSVEGIKFDHSRIFDLSKQENHSVVMLLIKLFEKGYSTDVIKLEKCWQLGHNESGYLDVMLTDPKSQNIYMIEVKTSEEIKKYTDLRYERNIKQVFSYAMQEKNTKILSFYAYDFNIDKDYFYNVYTEEILNYSQNVDDFYERWSKNFDKSDYIVNNPIFNITQKVKKYSDLESIEERDTKILFSQFLNILRLNSISDKPNAFMKMINLLLAKIADEISQDSDFKVKDLSNNTHKFSGMKFQHIEGIDTPESFMKRLNELYKKGMFEYLNKNVIDYNDDEIESFVKSNNSEELFEIFDNLRLKKSNNFSFIDIYDDETFLENFAVVRSIVELLENYKFKYGCKHQFLGDFFEELLNTSLKQEAGQFFTPYPIVDFMINSLPYEEKIIENLKNRNINIIPTVIDYACGAGHFLVSSMEKTQKCIDTLDLNSINLTEDQKRKLIAYRSDPYSWANKNNVVGIEKDYRLAKTTKIATFLNGDGGAEIVTGDGINKFNCKEYAGTVLHSTNNKNEIFDFVISNPPYSVDGYMLNFVKNGIGVNSGIFSLLKEINYKDTAIENFFIERAEQLLRAKGVVAVVLPQSILSNDKYVNVREFIFNNFKISGMVLTADITFSGTTTSPVILFLEKVRTALDYETLVVCSPKYLNPTASKMKNREVNFLGYEFSSNRNNSGIKIHEKSILKNITPIMKKKLLGFDIMSDELNENIYLRNIKDILVNKEENYVGDIYPKYSKVKGKPLSSFCLINSRNSSEFDKQLSYVEIGGLKSSGIEPSGKIITTNRYCKKGDILISSLCPKKNQIVIADDDYKLTSAIHVLSFKDEDTMKKVYKELIKPETILQMNSLLDGFKITYSKISEKNLYNNVYIDIE